MSNSISIIVPVYKVEPYIRQCVESILAQTYTDFELILVDDGSPDNCGAICDEYAQKDSRVRVVHQQNGGLSAARNAGLDIAKGEYVTFIDSDDFVRGDYLKKMSSALIEAEADISICDMVPFDDGTEPQNGDESNTIEPNVISGRDACLSIYHMDGKIPVMAWGKLYRLELFDGIRYPNGMIHEDDATTPKLLYKASKVAVIQSKLYCYRSRPDSITSRAFTEKRFDGVNAAGLCIDWFSALNDIEMVQLAKIFRETLKSKLVIRAISNHAEECIPEEYRISERKALKIIRQNLTDDLYCWYLSLVHPNWVRPHSYLRKIKQMLGIRGN